MSDPPTQKAPTAIGIKLFGRTWMLTGRFASAVYLLLLAALVAVVIHFRAALTLPLWISAALWVVMMVYWSAAAKSSAQVKVPEAAASRSRHQLLGNLALILAFVPIPGTRARWLPASRLVAPIGLAIQAASMLLDVWAMRCLGRNWSGAVAIKVEHQLIRTGPYRLVRHPIYTAMIGMYLGTAVVAGEVHGLLAVGVAAIAYWRKTLMEERGLLETFGDEYAAYKRESWALIPWVF